MNSGMHTYFSSKRHFRILFHSSQHRGISIIQEWIDSGGCLCTFQARIRCGEPKVVGRGGNNELLTGVPHFGCFTWNRFPLPALVQRWSPGLGSDSHCLEGNQDQTPGPDTALTRLVTLRAATLWPQTFKHHAFGWERHCSTTACQSVSTRGRARSIYCFHWLTRDTQVLSLGPKT